MENRKKKKGFTLIEMVVVIAIIAIIAGIAIPQAFKSLNKSKATADIANAKNIATAITQGLAEEHQLTNTQDADAAKVWTEVNGNIKGSAKDDVYWLDKYLNPIPATKLNKNYKYFFNYDGDTLEIGVGETANDVFKLFPVVGETGSKGTASPYVNVNK